MTACPNCGNVNPVGTRFCAGCATALPAEPPLAHESRKTVTVVFSDIANSTRLGERLDPESYRRVMTRYFETVRSVLETRGATVEKFIGDAVMAVFGMPTLHEADAIRAVRAAVEMRDALAQVNTDLRREWDLEIAVRTGVNTGEVVAGEPGSAHTLITGDAVVVAKRLEETAAADDIAIGESTYRLVKEAVLAAPLGVISAKGKPRIRAWRVLAVVRDADATLRLDSPLVARELELAALQQTFEFAAAERSCRLFTVLGPAGIGKSRLIHEFSIWLGEQATVLRGRCLPYGNGITFWPLVEVVKHAAGLTNRDGTEVAWRKIGALLPPDEDSPLVSERVASAVGRGEAAAARPEETFSAVRRFFEALARRRPLVLIFDDIQWAESTFLDLIEYVAGWTRGAPMMLCCLARAELLERRASWALPKANSAAIVLDPLRKLETDELIANLLGRLPLEREAQERVTAVAEGNPLFVEELLRMLLDEGLIHRENGSWRAAPDLDHLAVPPTIQALISARLDRLEAEERAVIQRASVAGEVFWWGAVAELCAESIRPALGAHLQSLVRKELIRPEHSTLAAEDAFRFGHILFRDAAYAALPKEARADLHERLARWLGRKAGDAAGEYEEIVGYHLEEAFRYRSELGRIDDGARRLAEEAAARLGSAGRRALARGDVSAAANLLGRAAELRRDDDPARLALLPELGLARMESGKLTQAEEVLDTAIEWAARVGDRRTELNAALERTALRLFSRPEDADVLLAVVDEAIPVLADLGDDKALAKAWYLVGLSRGLWRCRFGEGELALGRALQHARRAQDRRQEAEILANLGYAAWAGPTAVPEAIASCERMLATAEGHPSMEAAALRSLAALKARRGDFEDARQLLARAAGIYTELGMSLRAVAVNAFGYGDIEMLAGDPVSAEQRLREGYGSLEGMGDKGYLSAVAAFLSQALYAQSLYAAAEEFTVVAEKTSSSNDIWPQVLIRATRAKVRAQHAEYGQGEALAREALALASPTDWLEMKAGALLDLAEVLQLAGRTEAASPLIEQAVVHYERKGNVVLAEKARKRLQEVVTA